MSLNLSEKEYWKERITSILMKKRDEDLAAKGTSLEEITLEAENELRTKAGVNQIHSDIEAFRAQRDHIDTEIESLKNERDLKWLQFAKQENLRGISKYRTMQDVKDALLPREKLLVAQALGVDVEFATSSNLRQELMDAIMISTSSTKLKSFVEKVLDKHGVSDSNGLRALIDF